MKSSDEKLHIATIGKCVGLRGDLKLHLFTDFPQQFAPGNSFVTDKKAQLTIHAYDPKKSLIQFVGYADRESASKLINQRLFSTMAQTLQQCPLEEGEYFWFELTGAKVMDRLDDQGQSVLLGSVDSIERIAGTDYLLVNTAPKLVEEGAGKRFYIPYIPEYVERFDRDAKEVLTRNARDILEAS